MNNVPSIIKCAETDYEIQSIVTCNDFFALCEKIDEYLSTVKIPKGIAYDHLSDMINDLHFEPIALQMQKQIAGWINSIVSESTITAEKQLTTKQCNIIFEYLSLSGGSVQIQSDIIINHNMGTIRIKYDNDNIRDEIIGDYYSRETEKVCNITKKRRFK